VYDKLGNRTTLKHNGTDVARYQHNDVNEYTYIGLASGTNVTHDDAGNMTGDHDGYTYHYDYENRLTRVKKSSDTLDVAVYTYDALGRRIAVEDCIADTTTHYYYDGWRVLSETDDNDDWLRDYDYGNYIDEVLVMTDASNDHYFAHDHLFSVVALIDEDGDILEQYEYDAYGKCHFYDSSFTLLGTQKSGHGNDRLFTGQVLDILNGGALSLEYFKNRYKKDGRFITRDPLGVRDGTCIIEFTPTGAPIFPRLNNAKNQYLDGMSLYEYVRSNPILRFDPFGLKKEGEGVCCKIKETYTYHHYTGLGNPPLVGKVDRCTQVDIPNPKGYTPEGACKCAFENEPKKKVYGSYKGKCCWCNLYYYQAIGLFGHAWLGVECDQGRGTWSADVTPGDLDFTDLFYENVPVVVKPICRSRT
jgi:hypothetical protein